MMMMYVMHHGFRRDLAAFAAAARATPAEDGHLAGAGRPLGAVRRGAAPPPRGEDAGLWPALLERADEADRRVLEAMEAEHAEIDPILTACAAGFERLAHHADEDARAALAVRLCAARESLGRHLQHEETEAIAIIQRVLTHEEWEQIEESTSGRTWPSRRSWRSCRGWPTACPDPCAVRCSRRRAAPTTSCGCSPGAGSNAGRRWPSAYVELRSEAEPIPLVAQPLRGQRDLPLLAELQRAVGVPSGQRDLAHSRRGEREEARPPGPWRCPTGAHGAAGEGRQPVVGRRRQRVVVEHQRGLAAAQPS